MKVIMKCVNIKLLDLLGCFHYILNAPRIRHLRSHIDPVVSVSNIYAKINVYEIKISTLNVSLIFHQQNMVINESQGELVTTITQIWVRMVI